MSIILLQKSPDGRGLLHTSITLPYSVVVLPTAEMVAILLTYDYPAAAVVGFNALIIATVCAFIALV